MSARTMADKAGVIRSCSCVLALLSLAGMLACAFAFVDPLLVTVDEATLGCLALAAPSNNGTSLISYDLALVVSVHNPNWVMHVRPTAPLDAELGFAGQTFDRVRLAGAADRHRIRPRGRAVYRFTAASESKPVAVGRRGAAELARESAAGEFELELVVAGEFKYQAHSRRDRVWVRCLLRLALSTATSPAALARVECN